MLLSNHQSHLDPAVIAAACPRRLHSVARESLFRGILGWIIRSLGAWPIGSKECTLATMRKSLRLLEMGGAMLVFPEGTRTHDGELGEIKPGFIPFIRRRKPVVVPMAIEGSFAAWPRQRSYPLPHRLAVVFGLPMNVDELVALDDQAILELVASRLEACRQEAAQLRSPSLSVPEKI